LTSLVRNLQEVIATYRRFEGLIAKLEGDFKRVENTVMPEKLSRRIANIESSIRAQDRSLTMVLGRIDEIEGGMKQLASLKRVQMRAELPLGPSLPKKKPAKKKAK
jgi:prefoldin subunit 5